MFRKGLSFLWILVLLFAAPSAAAAGPRTLKDGAVFVMTNAADGNQVIAYTRAADGTLNLNGAFDTGGLGSGLGVTVPIDPLGSQNSLVLVQGWLFAVNAGSDQISVFRVRPNSLELTDVVSSNGDYPVSLAARGKLLYVLNAGGDGNITGYKLSPQGKLTMIPGSSRSLNAATPYDGSQPHILESPGQVGFSPDGKRLVVADKGGVSGQGRLLVFGLRKGRPSANFTITPAAGPVPFAFIFDRYKHLVVVEAGTGAVTSYAFAPSNHLTELDTAFTNQAASCWIAYNGKYIYVDNTGSDSISAFSVNQGGDLINLNGDGVAAMTGPGTAPLDNGVSQDGRFHYSLETGAGAIGIYRINADGSLTFVEMQSGLPPAAGYQGIAVR